MERERHAAVRVGGVLGAFFVGVGEHRHHFIAQAFRFLAHAYGVVIGFRHFAPVQSRHARGFGKQRLGLKKHRAAVKVLKPAHNIARDFHMRHLILTHGHKLRAVYHNIGRHEHGISQKPRGGKLGHGGKFLLRLHAHGGAQRMHGLA